MVLAAGGRSVDAVYLTDLKRSTWRGLAGLAGVLPIGQVVAPPGAGKGKGYAEMRAALERLRVPWNTPGPGFEQRGGLVLWREWSGTAPKDGLRFFYRWGGLRGSVSGLGEGFDWQFDIMGDFERRPRRALRIVFDGASARTEFSQ